MIMHQLGPARDVRIPQGTLSVHERGEGEPLLFVHGLLVNGLLWRKVVDRLAGQARCVTPHWPLGSHRRALDPGADLSPLGLARIVVDTMDALGLERATLVGNDTGGAICQLVAAHHPDRVERLVLTPCDAFDNFPPHMFAPLVAAARVPGGLRAVMNTMRIPGMARTPLAFGLLTKRPVPDEVMRAWVAPVLRDPAVRRDTVKALKGLDTRYTLDAAARLASFERPALLAWAREDRFFPFAHAERLAAILPDSRLVPIDDSYSFVPEDQPEALAEAIAGFVREAVAAGA
jgi:pimeloyl-ACP methyl ester carboxylesterase